MELAARVIDGGNPSFKWSHSQTSLAGGSQIIISSDLRGESPNCVDSRPEMIMIEPVWPVGRRARSAAAPQQPEPHDVDRVWAEASFAWES